MKRRCCRTLPSIRRRGRVENIADSETSGESRLLACIPESGYIISICNNLYLNQLYNREYTRIWSIRHLQKSGMDFKYSDVGANAK
mgnify:CR=1 FL=1